MFELDEAWAQMALEWEDRLETASGIAGLATAIADRIGHDRATGSVAFGNVLAAGTMQQLSDAVAAVITDHGGDRAVIDAVAMPDAGDPTPKGDLAGWLTRARELGAAIAVLTSDDRAPTLQQLASAGVVGLVDEIIAGDDELPPKPDPSGLLALCTRLGVEPAQAVMVGDSPGDMAAAAAAGSRCLGVKSAGGEAPAGAEAVVGSLDEIGLGL